MRRLWLIASGLLLLSSAPAAASGGHLLFAGGSLYEQQQVVEALAVSRFDWNQVPAVKVVIVRGADAKAVPGTVTMDADLLDAGRFSWAVVQHEFGHELDFSLLTDADRKQLQQALGGNLWLGDGPHFEQAGERFATMMSVAYWPSRDNCFYPTSANRDPENASISPAAFRILMTRLLRTLNPNPNHS